MEDRRAMRIEVRVYYRAAGLSIETIGETAHSPFMND